MFYLVVVRPFGGYRIGDIVHETDRMSEILRSEHADCVVRVTASSEG